MKNPIFPRRWTGPSEKNSILFCRPREGAISHSDHALSFILDTRWEDLTEGDGIRPGAARWTRQVPLIAGYEIPVAGMMEEMAVARFAGDQGDSPEAFFRHCKK